MKIEALLACCVFATACGGGKSKANVKTTPPPDTDGEEVQPTDEENETPPAPPEPPPPQVWHAKADLAPVKGAKMKGATVTFSQTEGEKAQITTEIPGLKAGTYHLVIHEAADCGKNATKAGAAWDAAAEVALDLSVAKGAAGSLDEPVELNLDGDESIIGHTLVLHADKKGKAGKAMACGSIVADEDASEPEAQPSDEE